MPIKITVSKSRNGKHKFEVRFPNKTVKFGAVGYSNYTIHKDPKRQARYITRHQGKENWTDPKTPGFWSRWLLWSDPDWTRALRITQQHVGRGYLIRNGT
jgi:hypothetical protein